MLLETLSSEPAEPVLADVYLAIMGNESQAAGFALAEQIRDQLPQLKVLSHCGGGNLKKQLKRADKSGAGIALMLGEDEVARGEVTIKYLRGQGEQQTLALDELIVQLKKVI